MHWMSPILPQFWGSWCMKYENLWSSKGWSCLNYQHPQKRKSFQNCDSPLCQRKSTMNVPESNAPYLAIEIIQLRLLGGLPAWTLVLAPCFFFSPFLGCSLFMEFGRVSSIAFTSCVRFAQVVYGYPWLAFLEGCIGRRESELNSITQAGLLTLGDWNFRVQSVAAVDHFFLFPWIQQPLLNSLPCNISVWFNSIYLQQITKWFLEGIDIQALQNNWNRYQMT